MSANGEIMTDADVAAFFGIAKATLQRRMRRPVPGEIDLSKAEPGTIGGRRFWVRAKVEAVAGLRRGARLGA